MSLNLVNAGFYDESVIDDRNQRPLTIALATIVLVWTLAFGVASVSAELSAHSCRLAYGSEPIISTVVK